MIKVSILITASKLLAYLILILGSVYAFIYHDEIVMITAFSVAAGLHGVKTWQQAAITKAGINSPSTFETPVPGDTTPADPDPDSLKNPQNNG